MTDEILSSPIPLPATTPEPSPIAPEPERDPFAVTVYTRNACQACEATKAAFTAREIPFDVVNVEENVGAALALIEAGYRTMPVVRVSYRSGAARDWSGHDVEKIEGLLA